MHHLHRGNYRVFVTDEEGNEHFRKRARTEDEALIEAGRIIAEEGVMDVGIEYDLTVHGDPAARLSTKQYGRLINELGKAIEDKASVRLRRPEIAAILSGKIAPKSARRKWAGLLEERTGAPGYSKDYRKAMGYAAAITERHLSLTEINRNLIRLSEDLRAEGKQNVAEYLDNTLAYWWGTPSRASRLVDASLRRIPVVRGMIRPLFLDRAINRLLTFNTLRRLGWSPRFFVVNSLQPLQMTYPIVGEKAFAKAYAQLATGRASALLTKGAISYATLHPHMPSLRGAVPWRRSNPGLVDGGVEIASSPKNGSSQ